MTERILEFDFQIEPSLHNFIEKEVLPGTGIKKRDFWLSFCNIIKDFTPLNEELLNERKRLQKEIDQWHLKRPSVIFDPSEYKEFLQNIGYLLPEGDDFIIETENVDHEICKVAAPQLVVPISNARYSINATNARWGSLYDALYGTDVISEENGAIRSGPYNPTRGKLVIAWVRTFLDKHFPLLSGSHRSAIDYKLERSTLKVTMQNGDITSLRHFDQLRGFSGTKNNPSCVLLKHNNLHVEIQIDRDSPIGMTDLAGISDVLLESAVTTIQDCEDSVASVDMEDKILVYRNWLGLMKGDLEEQFTKSGNKVHRTLNSNRAYKTPEGIEFFLPGRSLLFIRHVGHLMTSDGILDTEGNEVPEGIMDSVITTLISIHDLKKSSEFRNSQKRSIYVVKPKMHGPEEVAFTCKLFSRIETDFDLKPRTLKLGIMDEERRTTINLKECIRQAKERVVFINTGFLDRTGDEIHTSMLAGPVMPKNAIKDAIWIQAYEKWNVDIGLACGFSGRAQIGKGMWAAPDLMQEMLEKKITHPKSGANTSWVPSPTAATLHAVHYHQINVDIIQNQLLKRSRASLENILTPPFHESTKLTNSQIQSELENNIQGILGYVVRWINHGIGCSKVLDINDIGLMEDRATLRISSQHICNWLYHNICTKKQVEDTLRKMALVVDNQNITDGSYICMSENLNQSIAFQAASDLIFLGIESPNGYTEPILHKRRKEFKHQK